MKLVIAAIVLGVLAPGRAAHANPQGDWIESDDVGVPVYSHDRRTGRSAALDDQVDLSDYIDVSYYVLDGVRVGATLQFSERVWPAPPQGGSRFLTAAVEPEIAWEFRYPLFVGAAFNIAPRNDGENSFQVGAQVLGGARWRVGDSTWVTVGARGAGDDDFHTFEVTVFAGLAFRLHAP